MSKPLMPKATAVWLIDNTALTFDQIADFCELHLLEVKGIADGDVAQGIKGMDPIAANQLTRDEIERGEADEAYRMKMRKSENQVERPKKGPRYTPVSRRQERPDAIAWLVRNHPEITDAQVCRLVGTTKPTIQAIRDRSHWNSSNIQPQDPVSLGLCSQIELDAAVQKAADRLERKRIKEEKEAAKAARLLSADESLSSADEGEPGDQDESGDQDEPAPPVLANLLRAAEPETAPESAPEPSSEPTETPTEEPSAESVFGTPAPSESPTDSSSEKEFS